MILHQLLAAAAPADAVTGQAFACREALARGGVGGEIFAEHVHPELAFDVRRLADFKTGDGAGALLRYSIWSEAVDVAQEVGRDRLALVYHNITPGYLLEPYNPKLAELCDRARRGLSELAGSIGVAIADSHYNARELLVAGFSTPVVVPLLLDLPEAPPPREEVAPTILMVGRVAPSKRIEDALRAFAVLRRHLRPDADLRVIGGSDGFEAYRDDLVAFAERLGVGGAVEFTGRVSDAERDLAYREAGAYLTMSAHEGFCAPILEALAHGLTVIARASAAVPETLCGAGVLLPDADPAVAAEAMAEVLAGADLRRRLAERARRRLQEVAAERVEPRLREALAPLIR